MKFESNEELGEEERNAGSWPPACEDKRLGEIQGIENHGCGKREKMCVVR